MRNTSGIIINDDIFIHSNHVVKIEKYKTVVGETESDLEEIYAIDIYMSNGEYPVILTFDNEVDCNVIFRKIIMEMYGNNYALVNFKTK